MFKFIKSILKIPAGLKKIFTNKKLDQEALNSLEDLLISSDIGVHITSDVMNELSKQRFNKEITESEVSEFLCEHFTKILSTVEKRLIIPKKQDITDPYVIFICGVNGSGKTTTIGKLLKKLCHDGHKVMVAACDTFRAAATEQLRIWVDNTEIKNKKTCKNDNKNNDNNCMFFVGEDDADPASVAYRAVSQAREERCSVVLIDTAGRLHSNVNLMAELQKCARVLGKLNNCYPQETILILDGTTGQNSLNQVELFNNTIKLTGLIITKLDGTSRGGVTVNIARRYSIPVYAVGIGEKVDDLVDFSAKEFASALVSMN